MSRFDEVLEHASAKVAFMKAVRAVEPEHIKIATDLLRMLNAGRTIISHSSTCDATGCNCGAQR